MKRVNRNSVALVALIIASSHTTELGAQTIDRTKRPPSGAAVSLRMPKVERRTLSNGIEVAILENHELPIVSVQAVVEARGLLDPPDRDGLSAFVQQMLPEGTTTRTANQLAEAFADLGNTVSPAFFTTITQNLDKSLELMADMLMNPAFPQSSLDRIKQNELANLRRLEDQPSYIAQRVFNNVVWGTGHPYERVRTTASISAMSREDLIKFHDTYYRPQNVMLVVAGDVTPQQVLPKLEKAFGGWKAGGQKATYDVPPPKPASPTTIYLFDRPNSPQSAVMVGHVGPRRDTPDYYALELMNTALGGMFNSRINLNLRERRALTYGAGGGFSYRRVPEPSTYIASTLVVTPKTDSAVIELVKEIREIRDARPLTQAELDMARANQTLSLPMRFETLFSMGAAVAGILRDNLPANYYEQLSANMAKVTVADATAAARKHLDPEHMAIVIVGDRAKIEAALKAANIAPVVVVDINGKPKPTT